MKRRDSHSNSNENNMSQQKKTSFEQSKAAVTIINDTEKNQSKKMHKTLNRRKKSKNEKRVSQKPKKHITVDISAELANKLSLSYVIKKIQRTVVRLFAIKSSEEVFTDSALQSKLSGKESSPKRINTFLVLGILIGIVISSFFLAKSNISETKLEPLKAFLYQKMDDFDFSHPFQEGVPIESYLKRFTSFSNLKSGDGDVPPGLFEPAKTIKNEEKLHPEYNVVMIPGIVTSGLESWSTTMFKALLLDKSCWYQNMLLDEDTGLDPPGAHIRATLGLEAADYFMTGYWVWAKVIDNLSEIGYDNSKMYMASYDWRLSIADLETRDRYFTQMKAHIELKKAISGKKVVVISHSMGSVVFSYFINWVQSPKHGNGGPSWIENHVETWVNTAGALLGVSKSLVGLISGESSEVIQPVAKDAMNKYMSLEDRVRLFRTWGSTSSLIPKGGNLIWGDSESAPDDPVSENQPERITNGIFFRLFNQTSGELLRNFTVEETIEFLKESGGQKYVNQFEKNYHIGFFKEQKEFDEHRSDHKTFSNPLTFQLPNAPSMKIYNLYGVGNPTERGYSVRFNGESDEVVNKTTTDSDMDSKPEVRYIVNTEISDSNNTIHLGVKNSYGDGTVNLVSLGLMGAKFWKTKMFNPYNLTVVTREYIRSKKPFYYGLFDDPEPTDHIGILGNHDFLKLVLRVVSGNHTLEDRYYSQIQEIGTKIKF
ncbi:hypothetical protein BB560_006471 [Smittium megazygosporum]|uniref:Phospholipid:diacylglycerol acyltransferase n=1 Tax=Smittium megazygosporum TaxID=133381 RepID=A0A2T9Y5G8_9FUNG|nr:hypothetical protein BB560_006471 [Smittium megazygosporum]